MRDISFYKDNINCAIIIYIEEYAFIVGYNELIHTPQHHFRDKRIFDLADYLFSPQQIKEIYKEIYKRRKK